MKPKYTQSLDANHAEIVRHLRANRIEVTNFAAAGTVPDILIYSDVARWAEIKIEGRTADYKYATLQFVSMTEMPVAFVKTKEAALEYALRGTGALTQKQKDGIAAMLYRDKKKQYTVAMVERAIGDA